MKKTILFQLLLVAATALLLVGSCQDDKVREAATVQAKQAAAEQPAPLPPGQKPAPDMTAAGTLNLDIPSKVVSKGSETCVSITARNFDRIVSMQYTLKWDVKSLRFKALRGFNLPGLGNNNFGTHLAEKQGLLTYSWFDASLRGVSRPDAASLYEVCFEAVGDQGSQAYVEFVNDPVVFEITDADSQFLNLKGGRGVIEIK